MILVICSALLSSSLTPSIFSSSPSSFFSSPLASIHPTTSVPEQQIGIDQLANQDQNYDHAKQQQQQAAALPLQQPANISYGNPPSTDNFILPQGYKIEPVLWNISFPTAITFDENGTMYVAAALEKGSSYNQSSVLEPTIIRVKTEAAGGGAIGSNYNNNTNASAVSSITVPTNATTTGNAISVVPAYNNTNNTNMFNASITDIEFNKYNGLLYASSREGLYTVNLTNGTINNIIEAPVGLDFNNNNKSNNQIAFDSGGGRLYLAVGTTSSIITQGDDNVTITDNGNSSSSYSSQGTTMGHQQIKGNITCAGGCILTANSDGGNLAVVSQNLNTSALGLAVLPPVPIGNNNSNSNFGNSSSLSGNSSTSSNSSSYSKLIVTTANTRAFDSLLGIEKGKTLDNNSSSSTRQQASSNGTEGVYEIDIPNNFYYPYDNSSSIDNMNNSASISNDTNATASRNTSATRISGVYDNNSVTVRSLLQSNGTMGLSQVTVLPFYAPPSSSASFNSTISNSSSPNETFGVNKTLAFIGEFGNPMESNSTSSSTSTIGNYSSSSSPTVEATNNYNNNNSSGSNNGNQTLQTPPSTSSPSIQEQESSSPSSSMLAQGQKVIMLDPETGNFSDFLTLRYPDPSFRPVDLAFNQNHTALYVASFGKPEFASAANTTNTLSPTSVLTNNSYSNITTSASSPSANNTDYPSTGVIWKITYFANGTASSTGINSTTSAGVPYDNTGSQNMTGSNVVSNDTSTAETIGGTEVTIPSSSNTSSTSNDTTPAGNTSSSSPSPSPSPPTTNGSIANQPPIADAGHDFVVEEGTEGVQLLGNGSKDSDGTIDSYLWAQVHASDTASVSLAEKDKAIATFDAPSVNTDTKLTFKLTVTDNDEAVDEDTVVVTVKQHTSNEIISAKDTTPPDTSIESAREDDSNEVVKDGDSTFSENIELAFSGKDNVDDPKDLKFECRLVEERTDDGKIEGQFENCESPTSYTGLDYGEHTFEVRAIDSAGNADKSPAAFTWVRSKEVDIDIKPNDTDYLISLNIDK